MTKCHVCVAFAPTAAPDPRPQQGEYNAVWDTGASGSVITQRIADELGLVPTGITNVNGITGQSQTETYLVNITLPNGVMFHGLRVTRAILEGFDVLIGMDVIAAGDFAVTGAGGKTVMSFRVPSRQTIDFAQEEQAERMKALIKYRPDTQRKNRKNKRKN